MNPITTDDKQTSASNVKQAVELALIHRDIDDLKASNQKLERGQEEIRQTLAGQATQEDIKGLQEQLAQLMPWAQTLQSLERLSKWIAAIAAAIGFVVVAFNWFRGQ